VQEGELESRRRPGYTVTKVATTTSDLFIGGETDGHNTIIELIATMPSSGIRHTKLEQYVSGVDRRG
jgi:hypothetical protein